MNLSKLQLSRRLIFGGFALLALSTAITAYNLLSQSEPSGIDVSTYAQLVLETLSSMFAAGGWWFLCQLQAKDSVQHSLLSKAYVVLGLQFSTLCIAHLLTANGVTFIDRLTAPYWITCLGFAMGAIGFFVTSHMTRSFDIVPVESSTDQLDGSSTH